MQTKVGLRGEDGKVYFGWKVVIMGFILMVFGYSCIVSVSGVFVLPVTTDLGFSTGDFVLWMTIESVASIFVLFIVQKMMTEKRIKLVMIVSAVCGAVGMFGFSVSTKLWHFYLLSILLGICMSGLTSTPCSVLANNWFGSKVKGVALSLIFGGTSIGCMIIIPILNAIVVNSSWHMAYRVIGIALLLCIPLVILFTKWSPQSMGIARMGETEEDLTQISDTEKDGIPFKEGIRKPATWLMFLTGTLIVIASVNVLLHTQTFLVLNGYSSTFGSSVVSICTGILMVGSFVIGAICDRGRLQFAAILTGLLFAGAFAAQLLVVSMGMSAIVLLILCYGFGCPAVNVISPLLVNHMFGEKDNGRYLSYVNMFISVGGAVGSALIALILNATGTYTLPFLTCILILIAATVIRGVVCSKKFKYKGSGSAE